jgi:hypothetical protein
MRRGIFNQKLINVSGREFDFPYDLISGVARVTKLVGQIFNFFQFLGQNLEKNNIKKGKFKIFSWGICPKCLAITTPLNVIF